jgi:hypothetical protein
MRVDWFGWKGRKALPTRGPRWFLSRGANFVYISLGGVCSVTLPWFWHRGAIESRGYDRGWNAGYEAGFARRGDGHGA